MLCAMTLQQARDDEADNWIRVARDTLSDPSFWSYHLSAFLDLLSRQWAAPSTSDAVTDASRGSSSKRGAVRS
jgi:hypothetical protein